MSLSERIRPNSEAAPWVCEEVKKLERENAALLTKIRALELNEARLRPLIIDLGDCFDSATCNLDLVDLADICVEHKAAIDAARREGGAS